MNDALGRLTYEIEELGDVVKLTVTHDQFEGETKTCQGVRDGWPNILNGHYTLLEPSRPLEIEYA